MRVRRYDSGTLSRPVRLANGYMKVDAFLARTGVQRYRKADGTEFLEYRPPDEVFDTASLKSFEAAPLTNDHPPDHLDATNTKQYQVGHLVGAPTADGDKMRASILVTDAATIADMERGKLEISNGYFCTLDETPGVSPEGERYDAIQRGIMGNHVALVDEGRAGPAVRARMDAADAAMVAFSGSPILYESAMRTDMLKFKIDGVDFEIPEPAAQAIAKERTAQADALKAANAETEKARKDLDAVTAKADGLTKDLAETKKKLDAAPTAIRAELAARAALEAGARKVLGAEANFDGKTDRQVREQVAATEVEEGVKFAEKSDGYLEACFDQAVRKATAKADVAEVFAITKPVDPRPAQAGEKPLTVADIAAARFQSAGKPGKAK